MAIEVQSDDPHLSTLLQGGNGISVDSGQAIAGGGHVPKIRKPYTITKQRERWTEEEHKKFLEALKLYGRAWRKIEEHVCTKTAVQIRSHAQKFFSKVVRESSNSSSNTVKPVEIPPPRPKKKPMHPYPKKLVLPTKKETMFDLQEHSTRSTSPNSSFDQENKSPTSVLSVVISETPGSADSSRLPDGSLSPDFCSPSEEDPSMQENACQSDEPVSLKLELFPKADTFSVEGLAKTTSTKSLKLFGKTVTVINDESPPSPCFSKLISENGVNGLAQMPSQQGQQQLAGFSMLNGQSSSSSMPCGLLPGVRYINADPNPMWAFYGPYPFFPFNEHLASPEKEPIVGCKPKDEGPEKENQQASWSGSDTGSVNAPWNRGVETSRQSSLEIPKCDNAQEKSALKSKFGGSVEGKRAKSEKYIRGFVPYKRCLSEKDAQSSTITGGDEKGLRMRLCL